MKWLSTLVLVWIFLTAVTIITFVCLYVFLLFLLSSSSVLHGPGAACNRDAVISAGSVGSSQLPGSA